MTVNSIPNASHPIAGGNRVDPTWYKWLRELDREARDTGADLSAEIQAIARKLGSPDGTIDGIPESSQSLTALPPLAISGNQITLSTLTADTAGELFGISRDAYGRISALRPVVAGAGITIDGTTDPDEIAIVNGNPNPMTTAGDLIRGGTAGAPERLAIGTDTQVLTVVSGAPAWAAAPGGLSNPMTNAEDLIKGGASGVPARLAVGSNGQVLTVTGGSVGWATPSGLTNPMTTAGDIITGGASGVPQRLGVGGAGQVLTVVSGAPAWAAASGGGSDSWQTTCTLITRIGSTNLDLSGWGNPVFIGATNGVGTIAATNGYTATPRRTNTAAASATSIAGFRGSDRRFLIGTSPYGGFDIEWVWGIELGADNSSHRLFCGLRGSDAAATDVNPSTLTDIIGVGYDSGDSNFAIIHNDASGAATKTAFDSAFPKPTANSRLYRLRIQCAPGASSVTVTLTDALTGTTATKAATTDLPASTTLLNILIYLSAGGANAQTGIAHCTFRARSNP